MPLLACCSLVATGGLTRAVISCLCSLQGGAVYNSGTFTSTNCEFSGNTAASDVAYSCSAAVALLALSPCLCLRAALSSRLADQLTRAVHACLCSPCANDVWLWLLWCVWHAMILRSVGKLYVACSCRAAVVLLALTSCICACVLLSRCDWRSKTCRHRLPVNSF